MNETLKITLQDAFPNIAAEWHPIENGTLTPEQVYPGSNKKVWWKCPKGDDHEWQACISNRTGNKTSCGVCSNRIVVSSNCLSTTHPYIAQEWHPSKNKKLTPNKVTAGSHSKVWWKCPKGNDHEWEAAVKTRKKSGCGVCASKQATISNCLSTTHPYIAQEWHFSKNGKLTPDKITAGSRSKVWWKCSKGDDHEWQATIDSRKRASCGVCAGVKVVWSNCLSTTHSHLAQEWHPQKNEKLTPDKVTAGSHSKVWWKCPKGDDHEWQAAVKTRKKSGCPVCEGLKTTISNCLVTINPSLAQEWHFAKNTKLTPYEVTEGSNKKVWWKCSKGDDHEWLASINARKTSGCSVCAGVKVVFSNCLATTHPDLIVEWHLINASSIITQHKFA